MARLIRNIAVLFTLTLAAGCGASNPTPKYFVMIPEAIDKPEWVNAGHGALVENKPREFGLIFKFVAEGELLDNPDVVLNMMSTDARTLLATSLRTKMKATLKILRTDDGTGTKVNITEKILQKIHLRFRGAVGFPAWYESGERVGSGYVVWGNFPVRAVGVWHTMEASGFDQEVATMLLRGMFPNLGNPRFLTRRWK